MPSETIKLTAKFKLKTPPEELNDLFSAYREIVNYLIGYAFENNVTSFYKLKKETYKSLRKEYPELQATTTTRPPKWLLQFTRVIGRGKRRVKLRGSPFLRRTP